MWVVSQNFDITQHVRTQALAPSGERGRNARRMRRAQRVATGRSQPLAAVGPGTRRLLESRGEFGRI